MIGLSDIKEALNRIEGYIHRTPLIYSNSFSRMTGAEVYLKTENLQKTGSFKVRGAFNKLLSIDSKKVIAASMGNHAQGVAYAAFILGKHAKVVMPLIAPIIKQEATKGYGAELILHGENFQEALAYAMEQKDHEFIHAFDDEKIISGQGTAAVEILEDLSAPDILLVPVGGGGLISGMAAATKAISPKTTVIGVQTVSALSAYKSFRDRKLQPSETCYTLADGIAVGKVGSMTLGIMERHVDDIVHVSEDFIAMAILLFMERKKLVVEGAGAVPLAAMLENPDMFRGKKVVIVVSGGNIDFTLIDRIIHKGLVSSGRIGVFSVTISDMPGQLNILTNIIASQKGNIHSIEHDRMSTSLSINETRVVFTIQTRGKGHIDDIIREIRTSGFSVSL